MSVFGRPNPPTRWNDEIETFRGCSDCALFYGSSKDSDVVIAAAQTHLDRNPTHRVWVATQDTHYSWWKVNE